MSDVTEREKFEFEREKWRADLDMRAREIAVKEHEQAKSSWRNPLVVAIMAAAAAAGGNAVVAVINGTQQVTLENSKAESTRILEMIKTGSQNDAAQNLAFLLQSGLIGDPDRRTKIEQFLKDRKPGAGPALPAAGGRLLFEPSESLTEELQKNLDKRMQDYLAYLDKLGFAIGDQVSIRVEQMPAPNAYYSNKVIVIDSRLANDPAVALREYGHHVLTSKLDEAWTGHFAAIESGVADYLACSFLNNSRLGESVARVFKMKTSFLRDLDNNKRFSELIALKEDAMINVGTEVWGGALWAIRVAVGRDLADTIIASAWRATSWPAADSAKPLAFASALIAGARAKAEQHGQQVTSILEARGFPVPR